VSRQLLRCSTGIGANAVEAQSSESKQDFIHKLKIADKEARETMYWLQLCKEAESYPDHSKLIPLLEEIMKLLNSIIKTSKANNLN
jgi:four helix bundle protein